MHCCYPFSASVRQSDGHLIVTAVTNRDLGGANHLVWDVTSTGSTPFASSTAKTNIATNIDDHYYPSVFIDQLSDDIFVAYNGKRDGSETLGTTTGVYYTKSTDGGTNWTAGDTAYSQTSGAILQTWAPLMGPRFHVSWRIAATLVGNAVNSVTFSTTYPITLAATAVGVAVLSRVATFPKTLAATAVGVPTLALAKIYEKTIAAVAVGVATLSKVATFVQTIAATAIGIATLVKEFIAGEVAGDSGTAHMSEMSQSTKSGGMI